MGGTRGTISRLLVACLMGIGVSTFFVPVVTTDIAVHGRSEWSPLDLLVARADLWRPAPGLFHVQGAVYHLASIYLLMLAAVLVLRLPSPRTALTVIAIVGSAASVSLFRNGARSFGWLFYGGVRYARPGENVVTGVLFGAEGLRFNLAYVVLLCVMPLLAVIAISRERQSPPTGDN